jgi:hypothetical protein
MRTKLRSKVTLLFMTLGLLLAIPAVALAAELFVAEVDVGTPATPNAITVEQGGSTALPLRLTASGAIDCLITSANPAKAQVFKTYSFTKNATSGAVQLSSTNLSDAVDFYSNDTQIGMSGNCGVTWDSTKNTVNATVSVATDVPTGTYTILLKDNPPTTNPAGTFPSDTLVTAPESPGLSDDTATSISVNVVPPSNTKPSTPDAPSGTSPNQGAFTLNWPASTDDGKPDPPKAVTYRLEHKDANDANYSLVAGAGSLTTNSYTFGTKSDANPTGTEPETEGTWTYRVQASDSVLTSDFSAGSTAIKVDKTRPNPPLANEGTPDYNAPTGEKWFKTSATVSFTENGDPTLADGSTGSGVVSVSEDAFRDTTGALDYSGTATDDVDLVSLPTTGRVHVDATNPAVNITCPSSSVIVGSPTASANWTASDVGSGLATAAGGSVALTTSDIAASLTATAPTATDNVGLQSAAATCNYSVAASFNGFLQPIDGDMVNQGKTGRVYPVKWQLRSQGANGPLISDALGLSLAQQMSVEQRGVPCIQGQVDSLETEVAAGSTTIRYDESSDQFIFNYKAPTAKGCYDLNLFKADGVNTKTVKFNFTK